MVLSSLAPPTRGRLARGYWLALGLGAPFLALCVASWRAWGEWRFWHFSDHWLEFALIVTMFGVSLRVLRAVQRFPGRRLLFPVVPESLLACLSVAVGSGLLLLASDSLGMDTTKSFVGTASAVLVLAVLVARPQSGQPAIRVGLVESGRVAALRQLRHPSIEWVMLGQPEGNAKVEAVVADLHHAQPAEWANFLADTQLQGLPVLHAGTTYERLTGRVSLRHLRNCAIHEVRPARFQMLLKRASELTIVAVVSPLILLVVAVTALAIRLDSRGPVFYWQERVGFKGRVFRMVKFRSMRHGGPAGQAAFAALGDPRVTRVGAIMRRFRIDEIPQLYNVLRGEMSLIGPRPEQVPFVAAFAKEIPFYEYRHQVRPGITGWAQVASGYAASAVETEKKLEYDLFYVRHLSFWLDLIVLTRTLSTIVTGNGAR